MPLTEAEYHFCRRYEELSVLVESKDAFNILKISANLRLLLLNGLMQKANRNQKLNIIFTIVSLDPELLKEFLDLLHPDSIRVFSFQDILYPKLFPNLKTKKVKLKEFLSTHLGLASKTELTVKDIIKYEANVKGGVHLGSPRKDVEKEIDQEIFYVGGLRFTLRQLTSIARVTLEALKPLFIALVDIEKRRS
jgi:hypothetical protein